MENNIKFTLVVNKLNQKIADLNIKLSKDDTNNNFKNELDILLKDLDVLYNGTSEELNKIIEKYGEIIND